MTNRNQESSPLLGNFSLDRNDDKFCEKLAAIFTAAGKQLGLTNRAAQQQGEKKTSQNILLFAL